jgi:hypothetical protein
MLVRVPEVPEIPAEPELRAADFFGAGAPQNVSDGTAAVSGGP